ncbi:MAG TPA: TetR family transcriptional regulator [Acidimicrobiia bacterium]|nr:TetR family transcriptional regulator [Acidimicrobiia bacterium]
MSAVSAPSTRERLIAAAIEVFRSDGYEGARVQDVARAAGMTTGAIYANYRGKADLLFDAIADRTDTELDSLLESTTAHETRELLGVLGDRLVQPRREPPLLLEAIVAARRDGTLRELLHERLGALVARALELDPPAPEEWHSLIARLLDACAPARETA